LAVLDPLSVFIAMLIGVICLLDLVYPTRAVSMVGLPPRAGFFSKWYLISGALETDWWILALVNLVIVEQVRDPVAQRLLG
jgi:NADH:ubiquinone oxidoreductase subunit 2 (subunit N)